MNCPITLKSRIQGEATGAHIRVCDEYNYNFSEQFDHNAPLPAEFEHQHMGFADPGVFAFYGSLSYGGLIMTNVEVVFVMPTLATYSLQADRAQVPKDEEFSVRIIRTAGLESPCLDVSVNWGDGTQPTFLSYYNESAPIVHNYKKVGSYDVKATVEQDTIVRPLTAIKIEVGLGIFDFRCHVRPRNIVQAGAEFELIANFYSMEMLHITLNGSDVNPIVSDTTCKSSFVNSRQSIVDIYWKIRPLQA